MLSWWVERRQAAGRAEDDATALITDRGAAAYVEARRRERDALDVADAARWRRAALAIAKLTGKQVGLDTATRMADEADMTAMPDVARARPAQRPGETDPLDELSSIIARGERRDG